MKRCDIFGKEVNVGDNVVITEPHYHNFAKEKIKEFDGKIVIQQGMIDYQKSEIEELEKRNTLLLKKKCKDINTARKIIKSETIKEFAERLKEKCYEDFQETYEMLSPYVTDDDIDNLAKEMTKGE